MNEHSERLLSRIFSSIEFYEEGKLTEGELLSNIEAHSGAIEEKDIQGIFNDFAVKIAESIYLFDVEEGKKFLKQQIDILKEKLRK